MVSGLMTSTAGGMLSDYKRGLVAGTYARVPCKGTQRPLYLGSPVPDQAQRRWLLMLPACACRQAQPTS